MLQTIDRDLHPNYPQEFKDAVRHLFPILCFTPDQIEAFIKEFEPEFDGKSCVVEDAQGRPTFCRYSTGNPGEICIEYIIPSVWEDRYAMVKEAIQELRHTFFVENPYRTLRMHINEAVPSHAAYYMGLLAELGFKMTPRVTMVAPENLVTQLTLPEILLEFHEVNYDAAQLDNVIDVFTRAYSGRKEQELSAEEWSHAREEEAPYITRVFGFESTAQTWTALACEGKLIGCSFGCATDNRMSLEEVVLVPEFHGNGLGRYLTIRCLQKMYGSWGGSGRHFFLGTDRRWKPALNLYHRLGFTIDRVESYAFLANNSPGP